MAPKLYKNVGGFSKPFEHSLRKKMATAPTKYKTTNYSWMSRQRNNCLGHSDRLHSQKRKYLNYIMSNRLLQKFLANRLSPKVPPTHTHKPGS